MRKLKKLSFTLKSPYRFVLKSFARISKRRRFILSTAILSAIVLVGTFFNFAQAKYFVIPLAVSVYILTFFSILEGVDHHERLMLFLHPVYFAAVFYLFYYFLPGRWLTRAPYVLLFGVSIYAIMLSSNIFNVGAVKNLQLFRAAFSINFLFLTITSFLLFNIILSFRLNFIYNALLFFLFILPLAVQFLWSVDPKRRVRRSIVKYAALIALLIAEIGVIFSFVPVRSTIFSLLLTATFYSLSGLFYAYVEDRLFRERIREYLTVLVFVFLLTFLSIGWS